MSSLYSTLKDKINVFDRSNVIYKIPCSMCDKCYIGTTKNKLGLRIKQHTNDCKLKNAFLNKTALANHRFRVNHEFNFNKTTILDLETNYRKGLQKLWTLRFKRTTSIIKQIPKTSTVCMQVCWTCSECGRLQCACVDAVCALDNGMTVNWNGVVTLRR